MSVNIIKCSHQLVGVKLDKKRMNLLPKFLEAFLYAINVGGDIIHDYVESTVFAFTEESMLDSDYVLMVHLFVNLQLAAFVLFILLQFLNCNNQAITGKS